MIKRNQEWHEGTNQWNLEILNFDSPDLARLFPRKTKMKGSLRNAAFLKPKLSTFKSECRRSRFERDIIVPHLKFLAFFCSVVILRSSSPQTHHQGRHSESASGCLERRLEQRGSWRRNEKWGEEQEVKAKSVPFHLMKTTFIEGSIRLSAMDNVVLPRSSGKWKCLVEKNGECNSSMIRQIQPSAPWNMEHQTRPIPNAILRGKSMNGWKDWWEWANQVGHARSCELDEPHKHSFTQRRPTDWQQTRSHWLAPKINLERDQWRLGANQGKKWSRRKHQHTKGVRSWPKDTWR